MIVERETIDKIMDENPVEEGRSGNLTEKGG